MKFIQLNRGYQAIVDDEDYERLNALRWHVVTGKRSKTAYAECTFTQTEILRMHRVVMGAVKGQIVDHINGNGLDNRRSNLRFCTHAENMRNMQSRRGSSRFMGVSWDARNSKWRVTIRVDGRTFHGGRFLDEEEAARMYDHLAVKTFGEFARPNFPEEVTA